MASDTLPSDVIHALPGPVLVIGADHRVQAANLAAQALLGEALVQRHYLTVLRQPAVADAIEAVFGDGQTRRTRFLGRRHQRDTTWSVNVARFGGAVVVAFEDRTVAEEASQIRRDFVANVSHELKTPLTAMIGFIDTLRGPARADVAARERFLEIMATEAQRMNRLVSDLLSLSRVEDAERTRPKGHVDVVAILTSVLTVLRPPAQKAGITLHMEQPDCSAQITGDPDQLRQVFTNLIENAIKYGGKRVRIRVAEQAHLPDLRCAGLTIEVHDDGPGIAAHHLPRLTERFYRVDTHRSREVGGTGLGLAIVKHIISRHRGRLRVTPEPGAGSRFTVQLPRGG